MSTLDPAPPNFSGESEFLSPTFLLGYFGQRYMYGMTIQYDALGDAASYAMRARMPACAPDDALPVLSSDRQIDRGPGEGRTSFESRLIQWLDLWAVAGGAPSVLRAMSTILLPGVTTIETVNDTTEDDLTAWDVSVDRADPPTHYLDEPGNWDWDGQRVPGRAWVIMYNGPWAQTPTWGGGQQWGDGWCYGWDADETVARFIRSQVAKWKAAGCSVPFIIIAFDPSWFVPTLPPGSPLLPDGTWGNWSKVIDVAGVRTRVQARTQTAIYITGVS